MSVSAPVFDPIKAAQRLEQQFKQPKVSAVGDSELLRYNIAQMYQYYNQLIFRQGPTTNNRYQPNPLTLNF